MGDVITKVGDTDITSMDDLNVVKKQYSAGDTATFTIYRDGKEMTVEVTWDAVPAQEQTSSDAQIQENSNSSQSGGMDSYDDLFNYFFGGRYN